MRTTLAALAVCALFAVGATGARAATARFRYVPADPSGRLVLQPTEPTPGRSIWSGLFRGSGFHPPGPYRSLIFRHPATGRPVAVPVSLPEGTPQIQYRTSRVVYNYGSYAVEVDFFADGSVEVVYTSGFLRGL